MQNICVYCASSSKIDSKYFETARELGAILAKNDLRLIYGGGSVGVMGVLADSVLEDGGKVTGVIPQFMCDAEWQHDGLTELVITETMHERKEKMASLGDAAVALPGGCGTLEELLEIITWKQLGIYTKPIVIVNVDGYYNHLIAQFKQAADELFMRPQHLQMWAVVESAGQILDAIANAYSWDESLRQYAKI
ncbi:MAG: hypothetical protein H6Q19_581 [Bacteroidetes bacterium]|nr:hypothetical protein [Bacteroidota bacterium]